MWEERIFWTLTKFCIETQVTLGTSGSGKKCHRVLVDLISAREILFVFEFVFRLHKISNTKYIPFEAIKIKWNSFKLFSNVSSNRCEIEGWMKEGRFAENYCTVVRNNYLKLNNLFFLYRSTFICTVILILSGLLVIKKAGSS